MAKFIIVTEVNGEKTRLNLDHMVGYKKQSPIESTIVAMHPDSIFNILYVKESVHDLDYLIGIENTESDLIPKEEG